MNMTMTYDGTMVMPKNFAVVTEDEMTYVDGGWSGKCFLRNLAGFATIAVAVTGFLDKHVPSWREAASWGFTYAFAQVSWCIAQIAGIILPISRIAAGAIIVGGALAIIAMGEIEIF